MINVDIYRNENELIYEFHVKGHAGYAEEGYDIICSAVTMIVFNTINSIKKFTNDSIDYKYNPDGGDISVILEDIKYNNNASREAIVLLKSMVFGLESIENEYGTKYLKVNTKEV